MLKKLLSFITTIVIFSVSNGQTKIKKISQVSNKEALIEIEAEDYYSQTKTDHRAWYNTTKAKQKKIKPDPDKKHIEGASKGAYIEVLPETFTPKNKTQEIGVNFSKVPGEVAVLEYKVNFKNTGKYYVWVRGYCSSTQDNSIYVGMNNEWQEDNTVIYFCKGQHSWSWSSSLRGFSDDCSPNSKRAYVYVNNPGRHTILFSMREDGFEFDKFILTKNRDFTPK